MTLRKYSFAEHTSEGKTILVLYQQDKASTQDEVVASVYRWSERKRQFTPRQIGIAMDVLSESGWLAAR